MGIASPVSVTGFNPYSSGTISTTRPGRILPAPGCRFNPYSSGTISTTVRRLAFNSPNIAVSILILLEQSQQPGSQQPREEGAGGFNPYSSGTISTTVVRGSVWPRISWFQSLFFWNNLNNFGAQRALGRRHHVSILILLEQSQQHGAAGVAGGEREVSILILLEQSQQLWSATMTL